MRRTVVLALWSLLMASPAWAKDGSVPTSQDMDAIAATVHPQSWYPEGYYDVRIAAEAQVREFPRPTDRLLQQTTAGQRYNLIDCQAEAVPVDDAEPLISRFGGLALNVSRWRSEFERLGYPPGAYAESLLAYEQASLDNITDPATTTAEPSFDAFVTTIEANRARVAPTLPPVVAQWQCSGWVGGGGGSIFRGVFGSSSGILASPAPRRTVVVVSTEPAAGEVLLIDAFSFKLCLRKQGNPWDRFACKWNEIETGVARPLAGRFVYQIRWSDGTVRKGTREILKGDNGKIIFRKVGS